MARPRKKPFFDPDREMEVLIDRVATEYGVYNDLVYDGSPSFYGKPSHTPSLNEVSRKFGLNVLKVRKLLITAGAFSTRTSRLVQSLYADGAPIGEIMEKTGLSKASVNSYLPYEKTAYRMDVASPNADRIRLYRKRKRAAESLFEMFSQDCSFMEALDVQGGHSSVQPAGFQEKYNQTEAVVRQKKHSPVRKMNKELEPMSYLGAGIRKEANGRLWDAIRLFEGYWFEDKKGMKYRYTVHDDGLHFSDGKGTAAKEEVDAIFEAALDSLKECGGQPGRADSLQSGCPEYLYPVFKKLGVLL